MRWAIFYVVKKIKGAVLRVTGMNADIVSIMSAGG